MSTFLFASIPVPAHTANPLPFAARLVERGHRVLWYAGAVFHDEIAAVGAEPLRTSTPRTSAARTSPSTGPSSGDVAAAGDPARLRRRVRRARTRRVADIQQILAESPVDAMLSDGLMMRRRSGQRARWSAVGDVRRRAAAARGARHPALRSRLAPDARPGRAAAQSNRAGGGPAVDLPRRRHGLPEGARRPGPPATREIRAGRDGLAVPAPAGQHARIRVPHAGVAPAHALRGRAASRRAHELDRTAVVGRRHGRRRTRRAGDSGQHPAGPGRTAAAGHSRGWPARTCSWWSPPDRATRRT